jgi:hypothetical protein
MFLNKNLIQRILQSLFWLNKLFKSALLTARLALWIHKKPRTTHFGYIMFIEMKLLITGASGFIGQHLVQSLGAKRDNGNHFLVTTVSKRDLNLLSLSETLSFIQLEQPTHVLHLAWSRTGSASYDQGDSHDKWADTSFELARKLSDHGIVSWSVGTGLERNARDNQNSPYGIAKTRLKNSIAELDTNLCRWISMPYLFSIFHQRPRVMESCLRSEDPLFPDVVHDYLEIRDAAEQLANIVLTNNQRVSVVSSQIQVSNFDLCTKAREKQSHDMFQKCSCVYGLEPNQNISPNFYTSLFFNHSATIE